MPGEVVTAVCGKQLLRGGKYPGKRSAGCGPLPAWTRGRKGCSQVRTGRISVRRPEERRFCSAGPRHTVQSQMPTDNSAARGEVATVRNPAGTTPSGPETVVHQVAPRGTRTSCDREIFRDQVPAPAYAVAKATGRCQCERERRTSNFCLLAWETSVVAIPELLALETTASAPGGAPIPGSHGLDHRTRALSLPDAPGASGGRHHLILVPGKTLPPPFPPRGSSHPTPLLPHGLTRLGPPIPRRPPISLLFLCDLLSRTATSMPAFLSRSPARNMRNRTSSEHLGPGGQN